MSDSSFIEELKWRGMYFDSTPEVESYLTPGARGYIGFDPTGDSFTIGNLVQIMILSLFQKHGHQPIALIGGATGRIGDPSGKDAERQLKSIDEIDHNVKAQTALMKKLLDFDHPTAPVLLRNNYDWYKDMPVLTFLRDVGKTLTVNYMMSKESVKKRIDTGISYTEFSYQLLQGYDFQILYDEDNCRLQMGGSDQWGNITSGTEFIRRNSGGKAYGITTPLLTKADGSKFGKSESGAIWLSPEKTSPYKFYQYWLNVDDQDLEKLIKYFSLKTRDEMIDMIDRISMDPRQVKSELADELTIRIHSESALQNVKEVTSLLFQKNMEADQLNEISKDALSMIADEIPSFAVDQNTNHSIQLVDLCTDICPVFESKSAFRRAVQNNAVSLNKRKISNPDHGISHADWLYNRYLLIENGKKNKFLIHHV